VWKFIDGYYYGRILIFSGGLDKYFRPGHLFFWAQNLIFYSQSGHKHKYAIGKSLVVPLGEYPPYAHKMYIIYGRDVLVVFCINASDAFQNDTGSA